ncbi:MAG: sigma-54-dependent transcriptional regulator [bacterium]
MPNDKIMIADDDQNIVYAFRKTLEPKGYQVISASNGAEVLITIDREKPEVLFLDIAMPEMDGLTVLEKLNARSIDLPVIVITGHGTMQTAIRAVQLGAYEYLTKPLDVDKVRVLAGRAVETMRLRREVSDLRSRLSRPIQEYELIGNDSAMHEVYKIIGAVTTTPNSTNVLITGESGTGKELVARAIHNSGTNPNDPFIALNCTVLPETLLESELFGHEKGAFTGAHERKLGKFEIATAGTLLLDEIGDMSPRLQQKLLRVVEERCFQRLGGHENIAVRARFIAATNKDLEHEIKKERFREDLFFRLNVITIKLPPLRDRKSDIPVLAHYFVAKHCQSFGRNLQGISPEVLQKLAFYPYPGNVRELENMIQRAVALEKNDVLSLDSLPPALFHKQEEEIAAIPILSENLAEARQVVIEAFERTFVIERLKATRGNVTAAAQTAGIERQSFQRLMKKYSIRSETFRS